MKELCCRGIDWVSRNPFIENLSENEFCRGMIVGIIAGIVILLLLRLILWLCFRRKACRQLDISNQTGKITVNAGAVHNVLKYAAGKIDCLEITRIRLYRRRKFIDVAIRAKLDASKGTVPQIMEKLTEIVKNEMKTVFGIENIRNVKLNISACRNDEDEVKFDEPEEDPGIIVIKTTPEETGKTENPGK